MTFTPDPLSDDEKLLVLAAWFDRWDATRYEERQALLDDPLNPGKNDVQRDLRRIALVLAAQPAPPLDLERLYQAMENYLDNENPMAFVGGRVRARLIAAEYAALSEPKP